MPQLKQITFSATALFASLAAIAQSDSVEVLKMQELQPVEVRALRAGSNAPFAVTEISRKEIEKQNLGQDIPYLLQYTPSVVATSDAGAGIGYTGLWIRGTDVTRINVTLNGIPVNDAESQGTFFVDLPDLASSTNSIQIQRGVGTSTNGAGAFGATMSVSNLQQMRDAGAEASLGTGSFNTQRYTLKAGTGLLQSGWQFDVRLSKLSSDGYIERSGSDLKSAQFLAGWNINEKSSLRFMLLTGKERTGQAWNGVPEDSLNTNRRFNELGIKADGTYYDNQTDNYQQDYYQGFFNHKFNDRLTGHIGVFLTRGKGYYEEYKLGESFQSYGLSDFVSGSDTLTTTDLIRQLWLDNYYYGSVLSLLYEKDRTQLAFGGGYTRYDGDHYGFVKWAQYGIPNDHRWYMLDANKTDLNFYVKAQQAFNKLILFGDVQLRNVQYNINGFRKNPDLKPSVAYTFFNPKIGASYLIKDNSIEKQRAYASFAVANKEPNRNDFEAASDELPKPEQLYDLEAGYEVNKRHWHASANPFYMHYIDQLVLTGKINDVGAYTRTNVPESFRSGIELVAGVKPLSWLNIEANATFSQNKIRNFTEYVDNWDDWSQQEVNHGTTDIAFAPAQIFSGVITVSPFRNLTRGQKFEIDLLGKYVGRQYLDNTSNEGRSIKPYAVNDLRIRYSIGLKPFREITATLALNNVFDTKYESNGWTYSYISGNTPGSINYYYPQAGFNWLMGLNLKW